MCQVAVGGLAVGASSLLLVSVRALAFAAGGLLHASLPVVLLGLGPLALGASRYWN